MSMADLVSRRMSVSASSAVAAGFVAGVPLLARKQQRRGAEPGEQLTAGMIDFHVHTAPDTAERTVTAVEAARTALDRGLRAIVLKGTAFETVTRAAAANAEVRGIQAFGGVVFNWSSGGVNPAAVEAMVNMRGMKSSVPAMPCGYRQWRMVEACRLTRRVPTNTARPGRRMGSGSPTNGCTVRIGNSSKCPPVR
jgi:Family of unknown function (DUF6282)